MEELCPWVPNSEVSGWTSFPPVAPSDQEPLDPVPERGHQGLGHWLDVWALNRAALDRVPEREHPYRFR